MSQLVKILGAVAVIVQWLFSPEEIKKRKEKKLEKKNQELREAVSNGDTDAVGIIIDELREKYKIRKGDK